MATTTKDTVVSVRIDTELVHQLDDLAQEMERSRSYLIALAVQEFVEREYASLTAIRKGEAELAAGKGVAHEQVSKWIDDLVSGQGRPKRFR